MKLIATQEFSYGGKSLKPGDPFESATDEDARILKGVGKARAADGHEPSPPKSGGLFERKDERGSESSKKQGRGGRYNRADMRAKE